MTNYEKTKAELEAFKACPGDEVKKQFQIISDSFVLMTRNEQAELAQQFYSWAEGERTSWTQQPLKYCFAKLLLGLDYFLGDQHEIALRTLDEAQKLFEEQDEKEGAGICLEVKGGVYRTLGDFELSLKTAMEAYEILRPSGTFKTFVLVALLNTAYNNLELQNPDESLKWFRLALEQSEKNGNVYWINYSLQGLGKVMLMEKKFPEAKNCFERSLALSEKENNPQGIANASTELANYYFQTGNFAEAERLNKQALSIREQHNYTGGAVTSYIRLGEVYIKQSRPDDAHNILVKGLEVAEQIKVKPKISQIHFLLSENYGIKGDIAKSLEHYKHFHSVREQVEREDNARKLKNVQMIFEAEQTKKENAIIKKQKEEIERKNFELQETIDELTLARVSKKARTLTFIIAIVLFIIDDFILGFVLEMLNSNNYFLSLAVKMGIIFSLSPINAAIEKYMLKKVIKKRKAGEPSMKGVLSGNAQVILSKG